MAQFQPPPILSPVQDRQGVIAPIWSAFFVAIQAASVALSSAPVLVTTATPALPSSVNLGALTTGLLKATVAAGVAAISSVAPAALTRTNDTNVTLTLGGSPTTALVAATSLTLGWTGQLAIARGGTNATAQTTNGIAYFDATKITTDSGWTYIPSTGTVTLTAPASQNSTLKLSSPSTFASSVRFDEASTNIWQVGYNITGTTKNFELFNTANGASLLTLTANALATLKAPANQNAQFKADCTGANGFGSQFVATSKTTGGATNTWNAGTGVTGGTNAFEFFNDSIGANVLKLYLNGTIALPNLLTSAAGLVSGDIWCDTGAANVLKRV